MSEKKAGGNKRKYGSAAVVVKASPKLIQLRAKRVKRFVMAVPRLATLEEEEESWVKPLPALDEDESWPESDDEEKGEAGEAGKEEAGEESVEVKWRREHEEKMEKLIKDVFRLAEMELRYKDKKQTEENKQRLAKVTELIAATMEELTAESSLTWESERDKEEQLAKEEEKEMENYVLEKQREKMETWERHSRDMSKTAAYRATALVCYLRARKTLDEFESKIYVN